MADNVKEFSVYWVIISTLYIAVLYTFTRGAWLAILGGMIVLTIFVVWKNRQAWKRWVLLLVSLVLLLILVNISEDNFLFYRLFSIGEDVNSVFLEEDGDMAGAGRWGIWATTVPLVKDYYLLGSGPSSFSIVFPYTEYWKEHGLDNSHNEFLEIAFSMGIPALLLYIAFLFTIIKQGFIAARQVNGDKQIFLYGLLATIIGYLIKTLFNISVIPVAPLFWVLLAMCYAFSLNIMNKRIE
nr:O-antigen ligase family protein [Aquibacillus halophilus]